MDKTWSLRFLHALWNYFLKLTCFVETELIIINGHTYQQIFFFDTYSYIDLFNNSCVNEFSEYAIKINLGI